MIEGKLGDFFDIKGGKRLPKGDSFSNKKTLFPYLRVTDFERNGLKTEGIKYINAETQSFISRYTIDSGDVYISIAGTIGVAGIIPELFDGANLTENAAKFIPKKEVKIYNKFLSYFLNSYNVQNIIKSKTMAVGVPKLALFRIQEIPMKFPPLAEQQKIAAILDAADSLIQKDQQLIEHYIALSQSLFLDMFGDPSTNLKQWDLLSLGNLCEFENGDRSSNYPSKSEVLSCGKLFLSSADIGRGYFKVKSSNFISQAKFDSLRRGKCNRGDVLMTLRGNGLGRTCVFECEFDEGFINAQMVILRPEKTKCTPRFLVSQLNNKKVFKNLLQCSSGSAQPQFSASEIKKFKVLVPPVAHQNEFVDRVNIIEKQKQQTQVSLEKSETLFNSLLQRAFKGELAA